MSGYLRILIHFCTLIIFAKGKSVGEALNSMYQPYMVAIKYNNHYTCSGTIISSTKILTTASCVSSYRSEAVPGPKYWKNFTVYAGSPRLSNGGNVYHIKKIKMHDDYKFGKFAHDIAVLTLSTSINYSDKQMPIRLTDNDIINNSFGVTSGWGVKSEYGHLGDNLQSFKKIIVTATKCSVEFFEPEETQVDIDDFCGLSYTDNPGFCAGHSGSPMIQEGKIVGIVAWGKASCTNRYFDVYTNVYKHLEFIKKELQ